jgi:hypothetical protein
MADDDLENEYQEESEDAGIPAESDAPKSAGLSRLLSKISGRKMGILQGILAVVILASLVVWIFFLGEPKNQPMQGKAVSGQQAGNQPEGPAAFASREAREIAARRREMRRSNRSSHNDHLGGQMGESDLVLIAIKGELALLSGMFNHYMSTTAKFYELFRIMANDYVADRSQVLEIFENELLPEYTVTERRRRTLRRRVEHDPAVELYNRLDYIAYRDSIAVYSFREFITEGGAEKFAATSELVSESKFMIEDFRGQLQVKLQDYDMSLDIPEPTWDRYFGKWPW